MNNRKPEIDELNKKLEKMIKAKRPKPEIDKVIEELNNLIKEYLGE